MTAPTQRASLAEETGFQPGSWSDSVPVSLSTLNGSKWNWFAAWSKCAHNSVSWMRMIFLLNVDQVKNKKIPMTSFWNKEIVGPTRWFGLGQNFHLWAFMSFFLRETRSEQWRDLIIMFLSGSAEFMLLYTINAAFTSTIFSQYPENHNILQRREPNGQNRWIFL